MKYIFLFALSLIAYGATAQEVEWTPSGTNPGSNNQGQVESYNPVMWTPQGTVFGGGTTGGSVNGVESQPAVWSTGDNVFQGTAGGSVNPLPSTAGGGVNTLQPLGKPSLTVGGFILWFVSLLNYVAVAILAAALVFFLYGIFLLMFVGGANEESRSKGRKFMFWGIISLFVIVSVWGLVNVLKVSIFGQGSLILPQLK